MDDTQKILSRAVVKIRHKQFPFLDKGLDPKPVMVPEEEYKSLFSMLDVWDSDREDPDVQEKTKIIYEYLNKANHPKDELLHILTKMGATPPLQTRVDRVYKFVRLNQQADKHMTRYEIIREDIHALSNNR